MLHGAIWSPATAVQSEIRTEHRQNRNRVNAAITCPLHSNRHSGSHRHQTLTLPQRLTMWRDRQPLRHHDFIYNCHDWRQTDSNVTVTREITQKQSALKPFSTVALPSTSSSTTGLTFVVRYTKLSGEVLSSPNPSLHPLYTWRPGHSALRRRSQLYPHNGRSQ